MAHPPVLNFANDTGGTTRTGDVFFDADTNTIGFRNGGSNVLHADNSGNVGIGTSSPSQKLHVNGGQLQVTNGGTDVYLNTTATNSYVYTTSTPFDIYTAGSSRVRVGSTGNVGIGTTSPETTLEVKSTGSSIAGLNTHILVSDETAMAANVGGGVLFEGNYTTGGDDAVFAGIKSLKENGTSGNYAGALAFYSRANGSLPAERMRIDSSGNVGIGTSTPDTILEIVSSNPILTLRDTGSGFNNGDATLRLAESGPSDTLGGYFDVRLDASMLKFDFTPEGGSVSTYMAINSSDGNVGIGETSPAGKLEVQNTSVNYAILGTSNNGHYFESQSDDNTDGFEIYQQHGSTTTRNSFIVNDNRTGSKSAAFLVRGDGNVGINTSSPSFPLDIKKDGGAATLTARIYNEGTNAADDAALRIRIAGTTGSSTIFFGDGDSATVGRLFYDHNNDAMITYVNGSEVMRISSIGNLLVGTTTGTGQYNGTGSNGMAVNSAGQAGQYVTIQNETDSNLYLSKKTGYTDSRAINFAVAGSSVGTVTVSASATAYNTSSDYRLKENVVDLTGATSRLKQLEPKRFNFIADPDTTVDGFLAHEAQAVVPEAVTGTHNEVDDNGNAVMQGIDQSKLVPLLTAALQEAIAKIEALEARVTALES